MTQVLYQLLWWSDVDLQAGTVAVRQSLEETKSGLCFKPPKTQKGRRLIPLPTLTVEQLRLHRRQQAEDRLKIGPDYQDHGLVFAQPDGQPSKPSGLTNGFITLLARAGLPRMRFHDLRHGHATHILREGVHPKVVSERLGHSTVGITLDTYSHVLPGLREDAARKMDSALRLALEEVRQK
jgi:integrase